VAKYNLDPEPPAYTEGFLEQNYEKVMESLQYNPSQASLCFGTLHTTLLHAAAYDGKAYIVKVEKGSEQFISFSTPSLPLACGITID